LFKLSLHYIYIRVYIFVLPLPSDWSSESFFFTALLTGCFIFSRINGCPSAILIPPPFSFSWGGGIFVYYEDFLFVLVDRAWDVEKSFTKKKIVISTE
jgi:hypothetical protein